MADVILTPTAVPGGRATAPIKFTFVAGAVTPELTKLIHSGQELILVRNVSVDTARALTVNSRRCEHGRLGNVAAQAMPFAPTAMTPRVFVMPYFQTNSWKQSTLDVATNKYLTMVAATADLELAVLHLRRR